MEFTAWSKLLVYVGMKALVIISFSCVSNPVSKSKADGVETASLDLTKAQNERFAKRVRDHLHDSIVDLGKPSQEPSEVLPLKQGYATIKTGVDNSYDVEIKTNRGRSPTEIRTFQIKESEGVNVPKILVSPDGNMIAYGINSNGNERLQLKVFKFDGKSQFTKLYESPTAERRFNFQFTPDSQTLIYGQQIPVSDDRITVGIFAVQLTAKNPGDTLVFAGGEAVTSANAQGTYQDILFLDKSKTVLAVRATSSASALTVFSKKLTDLFNSKVQWNLLKDEAADIRGAETDGDSLFFIIKRADGQSEVKEHRILDNREFKKVLSFSDPKLSLMSIHSTKIGLLAVSRQGYRQVILFKPRQAQFRKIATYEPGETISTIVSNGLSGNVFARVSSFRRESYFLRFDEKSLKFSEHFTKPGADTHNLERRMFEADGHDGEKVPYVVIAKKDGGDDKPKRAIVMSYGSYGLPTPMAYNSAFSPWYEADGARIYCLVRGGGDMGVAWRQAGQGAKKINAVHDTISCTKDAIKRGIVDPKRLGFYSGSAGGLIIGGILNKDPELFQAITANNAVLAITRHMQTKMGKSNITEYGDPANPDVAKTHEEMDALLSIKPGIKYPSILLQHGYNDARVPFAYSLELFQKLSSDPINADRTYLRTIFDGGHGLDQSRKQLGNIQSEMRAFFMSVL